MRSITFLVVVLAVTPFISVTAQQRLPVRPGDRVRITGPGAFGLMGAVTVIGVRADSLVVRLGRNTWSIPVAAITRIEVWRRGEPNTGQGALIGVLFGGVVGAMVGYADGDDPPGILSFTAQEKALIGAAGLGVVGGVVGLIVGASIKSDRWEEVPLDRLRVSFAPQRDGRFAFGLSVSF